MRPTCGVDTPKETSGDRRKHRLSRSSNLALGLAFAALLNAAAPTADAAQLRTTPVRKPAPTPAAIPAVKSVSFQLRTATAPRAHVTSVTGGHEVVLRVELAAPAPCVERCGDPSPNGARPGHLPVSLSASPSAQFDAQRMLIATGQTFGEMHFEPPPVATATSLVVSAWSEGSPPQQASLTILPPTLIGFELEKSAVVGGEIVAGIARFSGRPASENAVRVQLQTTDQQAVALSPPFSVAPDATMARVAVQTKGVAEDRSAHVVAIHEERTIAAPLTVRPASLAAFERDTISCCDERLLIRLDGHAPPGGAIVALTNGDSTRAILPQGGVRVQGAGVGFPVSVIPGDEEKRVDIKAEYRGLTMRAYVISPKLIKPDLHFSTAKFFSGGSSITTVPDGQPLRFCAVVEAHTFYPLPNVPIPASTLRITPRDLGGAPAVHQRPIEVPLVFDGLLQNPQQPVQHCIDLPGLPPGGRSTITVYADSDDVVDESREDNNVATASVSRP